MAEFALGGIQIAVRSARHTDQACAHTETMSTFSMGVERVVCEACGHLSIRFHGSVTGPIERDRFARPADDLEIEIPAEEQAGPSTARYGFGDSDEEPEMFAHRPHLRIQRRVESEHRVLSLRS